MTKPMWHFNECPFTSKQTTGHGPDALPCPVCDARPGEGPRPIRVEVAAAYRLGGLPGLTDLALARADAIASGDNDPDQLGPRTVVSLARRLYRYWLTDTAHMPNERKAALSALSARMAVVDRIGSHT